MNRPPHSRRRRGFTLVELLAATAIMSIIILAVVALSSSVLQVWSDSVGRLSANAEARNTMNQLSLDIETSEARTRGRVWFQLMHEEVGPAGDTARMPTLYLITHTEDRPRFFDENGNDLIDDGEEIPSDICAVVYKPAYRNPFTGNDDITLPPPPIFGLYRTVLDGNNTFNGPLALNRFTTGSNHTLAKYFDGTFSPKTNTNGEPISERYITFSGVEGTEPLRDWVTNLDNFTSSNVVSLTLRPYREYTDSDGNTQVAPLVDPNGAPYDLLYADRLYYLPSGGSNWLPVPDGGRIVYIDILLSIISEEGMAAYTNGLNPDYDDFQDYVREYGNLFTRRVYLMANYGQVLASN